MGLLPTMFVAESGGLFAAEIIYVFVVTIIEIFARTIRIYIVNIGIR